MRPLTRVYPAAEAGGAREGFEGIRRADARPGGFDAEIP